MKDTHINFDFDMCGECGNKRCMCCYGCIIREESEMSFFDFMWECVRYMFSLFVAGLVGFVYVSVLIGVVFIIARSERFDDLQMKSFCTGYESGMGVLQNK